MKKEHYWPIGIALSLLLFVGFLISALFISRTVPTNLVSENYYQEGIAYQDQIDKVERSREMAKRLGWDFDNQTLTLTITFPHNSPVGPIEGTIKFYRPSDASLDISIPIAVDQVGRQRINLSSLTSGFWRVYIDWKQYGKDFFAEKSLEIP
ncbi:MAG: hypothetical protein D6732_02180 [Methanobacteriota archaeon]|nr:MAG: hypothetical protein D6732_02180 [Euryarchaeota archaeon]